MTVFLSDYSKATIRRAPASTGEPAKPSGTAREPASQAELRIINSNVASPAMTTEPRVLIRPSTPVDLPAITAIYGWNVRHGTGTFELDPPDSAEMGRRRDDVLAHGLPWLVVERGDALLGYAYANRFRPRPAYRYCLEDSIYLAADAVGRGIGRLLLAELMARSEAAGARQMLAVIGDSANAASINLHASFGFLRVGTLRAAGFKFGRWVDSVLMQRPLGPGDAKPPS